jgi:hypothetical protein
MEVKYSKKSTTLANGTKRCFYYKTRHGVKTRVPADEYKMHCAKTKKKGGEYGQCFKPTKIEDLGNVTAGTTCCDPVPGDNAYMTWYPKCKSAVAAKKQEWCDYYNTADDSYKAQFKDYADFYCTNTGGKKTRKTKKK